LIVTLNSQLFLEASLMKSIGGLGRLWLVARLMQLPGLAAGQSSPVFKETGGLVAVEAEHFVEQSATQTRAFYLTRAGQEPAVAPDGDPPHVAGASGGAYLEVLPDTRRTHDDKLIKGTNFSPEPGKMAVLTYHVHFSTPGRYYVWVRAYSTGSEDNGLHVGLNGQWPESGQRMQWCQGKNGWRWESKQRTESEHCGEPHKIYLDIPQAGLHSIHFSMREDGFEFDKWLMTMIREFERPEGVGPEPQLHAGVMPQTYPYVELPANARVDQVRQRSTGEQAPKLASPTVPVNTAPLIQPRQENGNGQVEISGELKKWHNVTLTLDGPYAHEQDNVPNPFTDLRMTVEFKHSTGTTYQIPGYFAADGNAANSSAEQGTKWRAHLAPDQTGQWTYTIRFERGELAALDATVQSQKLSPYDGLNGTFTIGPNDKTGRDLRRLAESRSQLGLLPDCHPLF